MPRQGPKNDKALVTHRRPGLTVPQAMELRPSDVISFSVWDIEETKLFGIMRDEMMSGRESQWEEARMWNWRRSQMMTTVFLARVCQKYAPESAGVKMMVTAYAMAIQYSKTKGLLPPATGEDVAKLLSGGN